MSFKNILERLNNDYAIERDKGTAFETFTIKFFQTDTIYKNAYPIIQTFKDWAESHPEYGFISKDQGIDLVAQNRDGEFCAIQCKFQNSILTKSDIDSFLGESSKTPFKERILVTTAELNNNANLALSHQNPPVAIITQYDFENSNIDWDRFVLESSKEIFFKPKKNAREHQKEAINNAVEYFMSNDRGKLIMACGTGKTFTALKIMESITPQNAIALFLVPSLSLLSQTLKEWNYESDTGLVSYAVCSDSKVGKDEDLKLQELGYPATTNPDALIKNFIMQNDKRTVVFSTYQSLDVIEKAQAKGLPAFDLIVCDEAHRTTGAISAVSKATGVKQESDSNFILVHDNDKIKGKKRLYMTATPRIYSPNVKKVAERRAVELCSMDKDNESIYGKAFYTLSFSKAVESGLLSDYQVMVLMVSGNYINETMQSMLTDKDNTLNLDDVSKLVGIYNAITKKTVEDTKIFYDKNPMKRAVIFAGRIDYSKDVTKGFPKVIDKLIESAGNGYKENNYICDIKHVDGKTNVLERNKRLDWLRNAVPDRECRILSNARCLSEGVDVPALDAVIFLNPKDSEIETIQAIGRVMRKSEGKKYGYIILPIFVDPNKNPEDILKDTKYDVVWNTLESLRAHDGKIDTEINKLKFNGESDKIHIIGTGISVKNEQLPFDFPEDKIREWKDALRVKIVEKCGDKEYLINWTQDIISIMNVHIARIKEILEQNQNDRIELDKFISELRNNINPAITEEEAIIMLSQHLISKPVFEALFSSEFIKNNPVSLAMDRMIAVLDEKGLKNETNKLQRFYDSVKNRVSGIKNHKDKQDIIKELYDNFFQKASPKESDKYGIVYTPVEIVDFIINGVEYILETEFNSNLENEGVHILDPFTGTGTFITRLIQKIGKDKLKNKYKNELHANEIMLLAYYISAVNIEETYSEIMQEYNPFTGLVLTDTFRMLEDEYKKNSRYYDDIDKTEEELYPLKRNSKRALRQKKQDIKVIIGNPPYFANQGDANENNKSDKYPRLDEKITNTYVKYSTAQLKQSLHDSYIRAFRWATDRIKDNGVICFITNGSYINGKVFDGFRKDLTNEFTSVYCFNLKGNFRACDKKEGENVFGNKCGTTVAITLLIKNPDKEKQNKIFYYEIPDGFKTEDKLNYISRKRLENINWNEIIPNEFGDWIKQRNLKFLDFNPVGSKNNNEKTIFKIYSGGIKTQRDSWCYNFSKEKLGNNIKLTIDFYNAEVDRYDNKTDLDAFVNNDPTKISWSRGLKNRLKNKKKLEYNEDDIISALYRPFCKQWLYYNGTRELNEEISQAPKIFPDKNAKNIAICINGIVDKDFSCIIANKVSDLNLNSGGSQVFPLYCYDKKLHNNAQSSLFETGQPNSNDYERKDNISGDFLNEIQQKYNENTITKEDIFYYIYGILNNDNYKTAFADDLTKMLPRIPFIENFNDFVGISALGKELADIHLNYENIEPYNLIENIAEKGKDLPEEDLYKITKMRLSKDKSVLTYNDYITLSGIPAESYDYVVNGKSPINWIIDRYQISQDKKSLIINDPNDLLKETGDYRYIINLIKKAATLCIQSVNIISKISEYHITQMEKDYNGYKKQDNIISVRSLLDNIIPDDAVSENLKFVEYLPVYSLKAAASKFSGEEYVEIFGWYPVNKHKGEENNSKNMVKLSSDMFIAKVVGRSMEPTIPDGAYCIFRFDRGGSRNEKVVLVESRQVADAETNSKYTVKRYHSEKEQNKEDSPWEHKQIVLSPDNKEFDDIVLKNESEYDFKVIAEFIAVL